jgi:hypothetical protein
MDGTNVRNGLLSLIEGLKGCFNDKWAESHFSLGELMKFVQDHINPQERK